MEKQANSKEKMLLHLMSQVQINYHLFDQLSQSMKTEDLRNLVLRIKMQKDLFIKELKRVFEDKSFEFAGYSSEEKEKVRKLVLKYASKNLEESCFNIIRTSETKLLEIYDELLINFLKNEIAKMIIRNHINEIRRDLRALQDMHDNITLQKTG